MNEIGFKDHSFFTSIMVIFNYPFVDLRRNGILHIPIDNKSSKDDSIRPMEPSANCWCRDECSQDNDGNDVSTPQGCLFEWSEFLELMPLVPEL